MHAAKFLGLAALAGFAAAQCDDDYEISDPNPTIPCKTFKGSITIKPDVAGDLIINGVSEIQGDLTISNASGILSISSPTLTTIGGTFELSELSGLSAIRMSNLTDINTLTLIKLTQLREISFGTEGITKGQKVQITDTFLDNLSGLKLSTVDSLQINDNRRLTAFDSDLQNITTEIIINNNGNDMEIQLNKLEQAKEIQIANTKSFSIPLLSEVDGSLKLDSNPELESFIAPNLTKVTMALSFLNNDKLGNVSLPLLEEIGGDLRIVNNTELKAIDGFPKLNTVSGGINVGGNFDGVEMPELKDVKGSVTVSSTTDISDFCNFFKDAKSSGKIQGEEKCTSNNKDAVVGKDGGDSTTGNNTKDDSAAGFVNVNVNLAALCLALVAGAAHLL